MPSSLPNGIEFERLKAPIISSGTDQYSPLDIVTTLGSGDKRHLSLEDILYWSKLSMPAEFLLRAKKIAQDQKKSVGRRIDMIVNETKTFLSGVETLKTYKKRSICIPLLELHVPKVKGCKSTFSLDYSKDNDYSVSASLFGFGGGIGKSRSYAFSDKISTTHKCLQLRIEAWVVPKKCRNRRGDTFWRGEILSISDDYEIFVLEEHMDYCRVVNMGKILYSKIVLVPQGVNRTIKISIKKGYNAQITLQPRLFSMNAEIVAVMKTMKEIATEYTLRGGYKYVTILPENIIGHCWNWHELG